MHCCGGLWMLRMLLTSAGSGDERWQLIGWARRGIHCPVLPSPPSPSPLTHSSYFPQPFSLIHSLPGRQWSSCRRPVDRDRVTRVSVVAVVVMENEIMELEIGGEEVLNDDGNDSSLDDEMSVNTGYYKMADCVPVSSGMKNRVTARKGSVTTNPRPEPIAEKLSNGLPAASSPAAVSELIMEPSPSLNQVDEEPTRFVVLNDVRNLAPFATCLCSAKPVVSSSSDHAAPGRTIYCQAIDCVDSKMIGCCNQAKLTLLFRSSKRVPYRVYCEVHLARLRRHHCCPGCGLFCTQGEFLQCASIKKQVHLFHKTCQVVSAGMGKQHCPHCASVSDHRSVPIQMNGPLTNNTIYYLLQTFVITAPKARITGPNNKQSGKDPVSPAAAVPEPDRIPTPDPVHDPGTQVTIPESQKVLSTAGMPLGPNRDMLQGILSTIGAEKKSPIRLTPNKNFYNVAKIGETDKVVALLMQGFDPNYTFEDHENETPLHAAAQAGHVEIVHLLIQAGADTNVMNSRLNTPLMTAIESEQNQVVLYLIKAGAAVDFRGEDGMTALHLAAKSGNREAVRMLLDSRKMDANLQDDGGWTALIWATEHKQKEIIELLLDRGGDPNIQDDEENICLHWAAFAGDADILTRFLDLCKDIDAVNVHGDTALHIACRRDHHSCILILTARNADISIVNSSKELAIQCCPPDSQSHTIMKIKSDLMQAAKTRNIMSDKYLHRDIAKGREKYGIPIVNRMDDEKPPTDYTYIAENCETSATNMDRTITSMQSCQCEDDCSSNDCICGTISFRCWYDSDGRLDESFNFNDPPMIFECNRACNCWTTCSNRVVQKGIQCRLQVFRTKNMGWGVRSLKQIPRGSFVCEYVGEIISDTDADRRHDDSYLFDLDHRDKETLYCVDARHYGNVARFINHGCDANLTPVKVFIDHQDLSFPRMSFFANRDIRENEELTFDYGEKFWAIKCKSFKCDCGARDCRYSSATINRTMQLYWQRMQQEQSEQQQQQQQQNVVQMPEQQTNGLVNNVH